MDILRDLSTSGRLMTCFLLLIAFGGLAVFRRTMGRWRREYGIKGELVVFAVWLVFCGGLFYASHLWHEWYTEPIPAPYPTAEAAAADGCAVIQWPEQLYEGEEHWAAFLQSVEIKLPDTLRLAIMDGGQILRVDELLYDGERYHYIRASQFANRRGETETYPYLLRLDYTPPAEEDALYLQKEMYVLTDKPDLTGDELVRTYYDKYRDYTVLELVTYTEWKPEDKLFDGW